MSDEKPATELLTREQVLAHLHLLTLDDLGAHLAPMLVIRGKTGGPPVLTPGRDIHFVLDPRVGAHVLRFADYKDFLAREPDIRAAIRANVNVETRLELRDKPVEVVAPPVPVPEPEKTPEQLAAQARADVTTEFAGRYELRAGELRRMNEFHIRRYLDAHNVPGDRRAPKREIEEQVLLFEKRRELQDRALQGKLLPDVPEAAEFRELAAESAPGLYQPEVPKVLEPAAGTGALVAGITAPAEVEAEADEPAEFEPKPPVPAEAQMRTMPLDDLRKIAAAYGIPGGDRREIIRAFGRLAVAV